MLVSLVLGLSLSVHAPVAEPAAIHAPAVATALRGTRERKALGRALVWLERHQGDSGGWSSADFSDACPEPKEACGDPGRAQYDVGLTGLSLLAFLRAGHDESSDQHGETIKDAAKYLVGQAQADTGLIGDMLGHEFLYSHIIATLALCRLQVVSPQDGRRAVLQAAIDYLQRAQNPGSGWRYDAPPSGSNDTSMTGWAMQALHVADAAGLTVDPAAVSGGLAWLEQVHETKTGRFGYTESGSRSSRITGVNEHIASVGTEALTALALHAQLTIAAEKRDLERLKPSIGLLLAAMPEWGEEGASADLYYWVHGTDAMALVGGKRWRSWRKAVLAALLDEEHKRKHLAGSWDPVGPWGLIGGRVYSTAMAALVLSRCVENS